MDIFIFVVSLFSIFHVFVFRVVIVSYILHAPFAYDIVPFNNFRILHHACLG
jgi:hypothetical protein